MAFMDEVQKKLQEQQGADANSALGSAEEGLQQIIDLMKPELEMRQRAMTGYEDIISGKTDITAREGYQAGLKTGTQAVERSGAARGMQLSGDTLENLASFGTQYHQQQRQQALSELGGLAGLSAPAMQSTTAAMGEMASLPMQQMQMQLAAQQGAAANRAGMLGGIGGILGGLGMLSMSDIRAKQNIKHIGKENGINIYNFEYRPEFKNQHGYGRHIGVIAQEVIKTHPEAVQLGDDGYMRVNYNRLFGE